MIQYKILDSNTRSMNLNVSSETFTNEWHACWKESSRDTTALYEYAKPFLDSWEALLSRQNLEDNINYTVLCARLDYLTADLEAVRYTKTFVEIINTISSVREELELLFFHHLRTVKYFPTFAKPKIAEYVIANNLNNALARKIYNVVNRHIDIEPIEINLIEDSYEDIYPDFFAIKHISKNQWDEYLLYLIRYRLNPMEMSSFFHIPRETFYYEEKDIWNKLKQP